MSPQRSAVRDTIENAGKMITDAIHGAGASLILLGRALYWTRSAFTKRREILDQMYVCGIESMPVTVVVALFTGMILAYQSGIELSKYGQESAIGALVSISMVREMGPFMTGLICAANVGSSMAAEIGTMKVSEEIDALEVMTIDPARFLIMPRILGMTLMCPILTLMTNLLGIFGGALIGFYRLDVKFELYFKFAVDILDNKDVYTGLFKALVFGMIISTVGCSQGIRATGGAIGVGQATRTSVIVSFLLIIILGFFMTALFFGL